MQKPWFAFWFSTSNQADAYLDTSMSFHPVPHAGFKILGEFPGAVLFVIVREFQSPVTR